MNMHTNISITSVTSVDGIEQSACRPLKASRSGLLALRGRLVLSVLLFLGLSLSGAYSDTHHFSSNFIQNLPFDSLSSREIDTLRAGERVFQVLDSYRDARLQSTSGPGEAERKRLLKYIDTVRPNFLAEMIMIIPIPDGSGSENMSYIQNVLLDVEAFDSIPYYSVENERWYKLFENSAVLDPPASKSGETVLTARHLMKPFDPHKARYTSKVSGDVLLFISENLTPLRYKWFKPVREGNLLNMLWIYNAGDALVVYGIGGARVAAFFNLFGGERMDNAFIGRVEAFFSWFYDEHIKNMRSHEP